MMHDCTKAVLSAFEQYADPERAIPMRAYMKDIDAFYGIPSPTRKQLLRQTLAQYPKSILSEWKQIVIELIEKGNREAFYSAIEIAEKAYKYWDVGAIDVLLKMSHHKPWWDTIDAIAPLIGMYFKAFPEKRDHFISEWMNSGNMWLQRICLLFQKRYKSETDKELLFELCLRLADEKEFFIRKGMGWALREYSYVNPKAVSSFVQTSPLSALTKKEAMKAINRKNHS
jgi:3-methyladenine DNA glycosylase AlkD